MASTVGRKGNVSDYLVDFCGGQKFYGLDVSRETIVANVADEVIAWHDLKDYPANHSLYRGVVREMLDCGSLAITGGAPAYTKQWIEIR